MLNPHEISFQLFSSRRFPPIVPQLEYLHGLGFTDVQSYFSLAADSRPDFDADELKAELDRLGMTSKSGHFDLAVFEQDFNQVRRTARKFGMTLVIAPWLGVAERPVDLSGWKTVAARLKAVSHRCSDEGLRFSWHNHDFEFQPLPDGTYPIDVLLGDDVSWEPDIAWVVVGKADPVAWLRKYRGRITAIHVKDVARPGEFPGEAGMADLGKGIVPWDQIWPEVVRSGAELAVLEHDEPTDYRRFARDSIAEFKRIAAHA